MKILILYIASLLITACNNNQRNTNNAALTEPALTKQLPATTDSLIAALSKQILLSLKNNNYETFAGFIHPVNGVRFSPYGYVDTTSDVIFKTEAFAELLANNNQSKINWGNYDGSGEPIVLSFDAYFKKFVYDADFLNAPQTSLNEIIGSGNSLNNLTSVYKDCAFTEHYFPGFDEEYNGMDWCSLRLVFKNYNNKPYLVAVVHDQWTI